VRDRRGGGGRGLIEPGTVIAERYTIVRQIGKGGMGKVYEAKHTSIDKKVAIKILNKDYSDDQEALERFQQEAKIAGSVGHINICEVLDFGTTGEGQPFLVMEYLEGDSVADMLDVRKTLPLNVALTIIRQVLDALEEVHSRGIVHRDLKPENIILANMKGHGTVVKLLDFGISKVMKTRTDSIRLTKTGTMLGTPYYMSPEQVRGNRDIEYSTDIWSSAVILYEMICGQVPFGGNNYNDVILSIVEDPFPDPRKLLPGLAPEIAKMLRRAMEKDPLKRYESATAFKEAIDKLPIEIGDGKSIELGATKLSRMTDTYTTARRIRQQGRKRALLVGAAVLVAILLAVLGISLQWGGRKDEPVVPPRKALPAAAPAPSPEVVEPATVKVTIEKAPQGVRLALGDKILEPDGTNAVLIEKGSEPLELTISADGFVEKVVEITPSRDQSLDAALEPEPKIPVPAIKTTLPASDGTDAAGKKKKKKMKPIWEYD
jgi:tRNA A-37 threonylcarbamoyl transferase component Bud32